MSTHGSQLEAHLAEARARPRYLAGPAIDVDPGRMAANLAAIVAELDAPRPTRLARLLELVGVDELTVPLVTATPGLRRSWIASVVIALLFAIQAATNSTADADVERIIVFLTMAPLIPLLGVALAFGKGVDPTHELVLAAPMDSFRVFLARAITVLSASTAILLLASVLVPTGGAARVAWLLPAVAVTAATMAVATRLEPRVSSGVVATVWLAVVLIVSQTTSAAAMFGPITQVASLAVAIAGGALFVSQRRRLDQLDGVRS